MSKGVASIRVVAKAHPSPGHEVIGDREYPGSLVGEILRGFVNVNVGKGFIALVLKSHYIRKYIIPIRTRHQSVRLLCVLARS